MCIVWLNRRHVFAISGPCLWNDSLVANTQSWHFIRWLLLIPFPVSFLNLFNVLFWTSLSCWDLLFLLKPLPNLTHILPHSSCCPFHIASKDDNSRSYSHHCKQEIWDSHRTQKKSKKDDTGSKIRTLVRESIVRVVERFSTYLRSGLQFTIYLIIISYPRLFLAKRVSHPSAMAIGTFNGRGVGFGLGIGCGFGAGFGFGGAPLNSFGLGVGGGCGVGIGIGWGFGFAYGARYIDSQPVFQGMNFKSNQAKGQDELHSKDWVMMQKCSSLRGQKEKPFYKLSCWLFEQHWLR